jgi:hypothetical protein
MTRSTVGGQADLRFHAAGRSLVARTNVTALADLISPSSGSWKGWLAYSDPTEGILALNVT